MSRPAIVLTHVFPPIPDRRWDWSAARDGYEPGDPIGYGRTPEEATTDLLDIEWEMTEEVA